MTSSVLVLIILLGVFKYGFLTSTFKYSESTTGKECLYYCYVADTGSTIMCFECNSATNSLCNESIPPDSLRKNCSDHERGVTHTLCRKIVQYVDYGINGQLPSSRVIRSCGWDESKYKSSCYHRSGYGGRQEVCSCKSDFCNSSSEITPTTLFTLATTILTAQLFV